MPTEPALTPAVRAELLDHMARILAKLDEYGLGIPASYVQLAIDHARLAIDAGLSERGCPELPNP
jgi:hypothetical protein